MRTRCLTAASTHRRGGGTHASAAHSTGGRQNVVGKSGIEDEKRREKETIEDEERRCEKEWY